MAIDKVKWCRQCGHKDSIVSDVRSQEGGIVRRRKCPACGFRWSTIELDFWEAKQVVRKYEMLNKEKTNDG